MKTNILHFFTKSFRSLNRLFLLLLAVPLSLFAQIEPIPMHVQSYSWDFTPANHRTEIIEHVVDIPDAIWLRVYFEDVNLGSNSYVIATSLKDGAQQKLNAEEIKKWDYSTAYFNGSKIKLELHKSSLDKDVSLKISEVEVGEPGTGSLKSICGSADDRIRSYDDAIGRIMPIGCTGWIIKNGKHVTAGHCNGRRMQILEFNVPLSASNGNVKHPAPKHQYTINKSSIKEGRRDWAVFECNKNSETGKTTIEAQGKAFNVVKKNNANTIRITGYGTDGGRRNQVQQTHTGPFSRATSTKLYYRVDTKGGNSGSPVIDESTGNAIGVHTNGGCRSNGGTNSGTIASLSAFWNAMGLSEKRSSAPIGMSIYLKGSNGKYVCSENGAKPMNCDRDHIGSWERFTVINAGNGKVALRGSNGKYVCSENGALPIICDRENLGPWEKFTWVDLGNNKVALRGSNEKYMCSENGAKPMTCDRGSIGPWETFTWGSATVIPIGQTIFIKGNNGKHVCSENGAKPMNCDRGHVGPWEKFTVINAGNGKIALRGNNGKYVCSENGALPIICDRGQIGPWEKFTWVEFGDNKFALIGSNNKYVSSENGAKPMTCDRGSIGPWETFTWGGTSRSEEIDNNEQIKESLSLSEDIDRNSEFSIYPNPISSGLLNIVAQTDENIRIRLINAQGQTILSKEYPGAPLHELEVSQYPKGYYIIIIEGNNNTEVEKLIFE